MRFVCDACQDITNIEADRAGEGGKTMTGKEIAQALRCTSTPGDHASNCEQCPYWKKEQLNGRLKEKLGTDTWTSCDIDKVGLDGADLIERLTAENAALREKVPQWISVKDADRRAPAGQRVIATDGVFVGEAYRTSADSWRRYDDYRLWHDATGHTVTHWMPLPEVPEEGEA